VCHRAAGIGLTNRRERLARFIEPERVQERDGTVELLLRCCTTGNLKVNLSEFFSCPLLCSSQ
jgi:hypothetical protein